MKKTLIAAALGFVALAAGWSIYRWLVEEPVPAAALVDWRPSAPDRSSAPSEHVQPVASASERTDTEEQPASAEPQTRTAGVKLAPTVTLHGRVRNIVATESPLPELEIRFVIGGRVHKAFVAAGQEYRVSGIPPGRARIRIQARGYEPTVENRDISEQPPEQKLDFFLRPRDSLYVRLIAPDGRPLLEALRAEEVFAAPPEIAIVATTDVPGGTMPLVDSSAYSGYANGRTVLELKPRDWEAPNEYARFVKIDEAFPLYVSACRASVVLATQYVPSGTSEVTLSVSLEALRASTGTAHMRIVAAEDGRLLEEAGARLDFVRNPNARLLTTRRILGGDDLPRVGGDVSFRELDPGIYMLTISAPGRERVRARVRVEPGTVTELGTYRLAGMVTVDGLAADEQGAVALTQIELVPIAGADVDEGAIGQESRSDSHGRFRFEQVGARKYVLRGRSAQGVVRPIVVDASHGDVRDLLVKVEPGTSVFLRLDPAVPKESAIASEHAVTIYDEANRPVVTTPLADVGRVQLLLLPGAYTFEATRRGARIARGSFEVASAPVEVTIQR